MSAPIDGAALEQELARLADDRREAANLRAKLAHVTEALEAADALVERTRAALAEEQDDVTRLETLSLTRVLHSLSGSRSAELDRERAERDAARYAFAEADDRRKTTYRELQRIQDRLVALGDVDARWEAALHQRERWLEATGEPGAAEAVGLATQRGVVDAELREAEEALAAAERAMALLARAADLLGPPETWDGIDRWFGGAIAGGVHRHERLDEATELLRQVDAAMTALDRELADVEHATLAPLRFEAWDRAFDAMFEGLFTDLAVAKRLTEAIQRVGQARVTVERTADELARGRTTLAGRRGELDDARRRLLT